MKYKGYGGHNVNELEVMVKERDEEIILLRHNLVLARNFINEVPINDPEIYELYQLYYKEYNKMGDLK